ncbi:MAG: hypothetical protein AABO58_24055 [Acidobacteriota bacterium]
MNVRREPLDSPVAVALIAALNGELAAMYNNPAANHFRLDAGEVAPRESRSAAVRSGGSMRGRTIIRG